MLYHTILREGTVRALLSKGFSYTKYSLCVAIFTIKMHVKRNLYYKLLRRAYKTVVSIL